MNLEMIVTGFLFGIGFALAQALVSALLNAIARRSSP